MALDIYEPFARYTGAGNLADYTFDFKISQADQVLIVVNDDSGAEYKRVRGDDTTYLSSVTFDSVSGGGMVSLLANLPTNFEIFIFLAGDEPNQPSEFSNKKDFTLKRIEAAFDTLGAFIQRTFFLAKRSVSLYDTDDIESFDTVLPKGLDANTDELVPVVQQGGWAPLSSWLFVSDILAALLSSPVSTVPQIIGSRAAPDTTSGAILFGTAKVYWDYRWFIQGLAGPVTVTSIEAGNSVGQRINFKIPAGSANTLTIPDTAIRFELTGGFVGTAGRSITVEWNGTNWEEIGRN